MIVDFLLLPQPGSPELLDLIASGPHRVLYDFLHERKNDPPTMVEIRAHAAAVAGASHSQTDRRVRDLRDVYGIEVPCRRIDGKPRYVLEGLRDPTEPRRIGISRRLRAHVLLSQRCAQCGKTPNEDGVKLEVDHKLPLKWGGDSDIDNLQALCHECNNGKRDYFTSIDQHTDKIRAAATWLEPHKRIGEALKAFEAAGELAPSQIIAVVACMHQFQEDWQKRMRELKVLDWQYRVHYRYEDGRKRSYYELTAWTPWPHGDVAAEIRRRERARKADKKSASS
ncbi:HNH endonuclease [Paenarthrobacter nicotinovorans]|uniref:HNH endonuclease n=1 Tax=Paenarthrobacter nicotinovorans TaxID=29320 RepID=UPI00380BDA7F